MYFLFLKINKIYQNFNYFLKFYINIDLAHQKVLLQMHFNISQLSIFQIIQVQVKIKF